MELSLLFKSVLEQDTAPVVLCDLDDTIVYINPAAHEHYIKYGGYKIVNTDLKIYHNDRSCEIIKNVVAWFGASKDNNIVHTFYNQKENKDVYMVALRDDNGVLIGYYEKHEYRNRDEMPLYKMD